MRIAVLGAGGFIGNRIVEMLTLLDLAEVRPVVRRAQSLALASRLSLDGRVADAHDAEALQIAFAGCDAVIHAIAGDPATITGTVEPTYRAAVAAGIRRMVYLSSASVHGQSPAPGTAEQSPLSTHQPIAYNNAKVRAERRFASLRAKGPTELVTLRPSIVYGPRSQWIAGFADELLAGSPVLVDGGGGVCNGIYIDNLVHAVWLALQTPVADRRAYLLGDAETYTWADLYRPLAEAFGRRLEDIPPALVSRRESTAIGLWRHPLTKSLRKRVPAPLRAGLRAAWEASRATGAPVPDALPSAPIASFEISLLHRCAVKLPNHRAARELGYEPPVSFATAIQRTIGWLTFAGYPVHYPQAD